MIERKRDLFVLLAKHQEQVKEFGVKWWGVFGSFARGQQNTSSDVDILVEFEQGKKSFDNFMHLAFFLEEQVGRENRTRDPRVFECAYRSAYFARG